MSDGSQATEPDVVVLWDVRCTCGAKLVDRIDPPEVQVGDDRIPFRRTTDYLVCPACASMHRVTDLGTELVGDGRAGRADEAGDDRD